MKKGSRFFAFLLSVMLVAGAMQMPVIAAEDFGENTTAEATTSDDSGMRVCETVDSEDATSESVMEEVGVPDSTVDESTAYEGITNAVSEIEDPDYSSDMSTTETSVLENGNLKASDDSVMDTADEKTSNTESEYTFEEGSDPTDSLSDDYYAEESSSGSDFPDDDQHESYDSGSYEEPAESDHHEGMDNNTVVDSEETDGGKVDRGQNRTESEPIDASLEEEYIWEEGDEEIISSPSQNSGECGHNLTWRMEGSTLIIEGSGEMFHYTPDENPAPWLVDRWSIDSIIIGEGVTTIGSCAFYRCSVRSITLPKSLERISMEAFLGCDAIEEVYYNGTKDQWNGVIVDSTNNGYLLHTPHFPDEDKTSIDTDSTYEGIAGVEFSISVEINSNKISPNSSNVTFAVTALEGQTGTISGGAFSVVTSDVNKYIISQLVTIAEEGKYELEVSFNGKTSKASIIVKQDKRIDISNGIAVVPKTSFEYTGSAIKPFVMGVRADGGKDLKENTDYIVSYYNNINVGTGTINITGKGDYTGIIIVTFKIKKAKQSITVKSTASNIVIDKKATISITGAKGKKSFKSSDSSIAVVNSTTGVVTGKKAGTVMITAVSAATANYESASKTIKIKVIPSKPGNCHFVKWNNTKYNSCQIAWNKVKRADGYQTILSWTDGSHAVWKDLKVGNLKQNCSVVVNHVSQFKVRAYAYTPNGRVFSQWSNLEYITPSPTSLKYKNTGTTNNPKAKISWNIIYGCNGYNVFVSTNPKGTWYWNQSTDTKATATSAVITKYRGKKLKKGTRYYVRIVTRRKRNGVFCTVPLPSSSTYIGSFKIK